MSFCVKCSTCESKSPPVEKSAEVTSHGWRICSTERNGTTTTTFTCPTCTQRTP